MPESLWNRCLRVLEGELPEQQFNTWVRPLQAVERDGELKLLAPNRYVIEWLGQNLLPRIKELILAFAEGLAPEMALDVGTRAGIVAQVPVALRDARRDWPLPAHASWRRWFSAAASMPNLPSTALSRARATNSPRRRRFKSLAIPASAYNPLFIYGGVGLGKTHLMHAVANKLKERNSEARLAYVHSERFVGDMVRALQHNTINDFKAAYRSLDCLMIDDIQFFAGKDRSQEEFFHTFNALLESQQQVILTCDRYPKEVDGLEERLKSRFGWGLTVAIEPPELETCVAILMSKAAMTHVDLPEEVAFFIAKRIRSNVRELEGALRRVVATSNFTGRPITLEFAKEALRDLLGVARKAGHDRKYPKNRGRVLQNQDRGFAVEAPQPFDCAAAASGDGVGQGIDQSQPAGDRRCIWRPGPYDGAACVQARQGIARDGSAHWRGLFEPVENPGGIGVGKLWMELWIKISTGR